MMIRNERLYKISKIISIQYYIVEAVIFLSSWSALSVKGLQANVPLFEPRENNVSFYAGDTATLLCSVTGLQTRLVVWRRTSEPNPLTIGDFVYSPDDRITVRRVEDKSEWNLIIKDVQIADAGIYECAVSSREKYKRLVLLRVNGTPRRFKGSAHYKDQDSIKSQVLISGQRFVSKGQTILLTCNATGVDFAPDGVDWYINGQKVNHQTMPRVRIYDPVVDNNKRTLLSTLEIRRSLMHDKGIYVCLGPEHRTGSLAVHILDGTPRRFKGSAHDKDQDSIKSQVLMSGQRFVIKGQTILLTCNATGEDFAPDGVDWFINGHKVNNQTMPRVRIYDPVVDNNTRTLLSTLEIRRSIMNDKGTYVCIGPEQRTNSLSVIIYEKSSIDKRDDGSPSHGYVSDSAIPCCSFKWDKQCSIVMLCLSATWFVT
ncbi:hemicentin-1-like isoform X2 [Mytilus edulis]|uniref:hemicentin-1-like isoform X2 n=1 Tax=Mytilus edulis TaxID=6550 RepID=UPI0039F10F8B